MAATRCADRGWHRGTGMVEASKRILVWWMEVDAPPATVVADWRCCLDAAEQVRADRFYVDEDRTTYIAAHWLIRSALASVGGLPPADSRFVATDHGQPAIVPVLVRPDL